MNVCLPSVSASCSFRETNAPAGATVTRLAATKTGAVIRCGLMACALMLPQHVVLADATAATDAGANELQEVVVTAQQRAQPLQDVPLTVTALSGDFLTEHHL